MKTIGMIVGIVGGIVLLVVAGVVVKCCCFNGESDAQSKPDEPSSQYTDVKMDALGASGGAGAIVTVDGGESSSPVDATPHADHLAPAVGHERLGDDSAAPAQRRGCC